MVIRCVKYRLLLKDPSVVTKVAGMNTFTGDKILPQYSSFTQRQLSALQMLIHQRCLAVNIVRQSLTVTEGIAGDVKCGGVLAGKRKDIHRAVLILVRKRYPAFGEKTDSVAFGH